MMRSGIEPTTHNSRGERSTTEPSRRGKFVWEISAIIVNRLLTYNLCNEYGKVSSFIIILLLRFVCQARRLSSYTVTCFKYRAG